MKTQVFSPRYAFLKFELWNFGNFNRQKFFFSNCKKRQGPFLSHQNDLKTWPRAFPPKKNTPSAEMGYSHSKIREKVCHIKWHLREKVKKKWRKIREIRESWQIPLFLAVFSSESTRNAFFALKTHIETPRPS